MVHNPQSASQSGRSDSGVSANGDAAAVIASGVRALTLPGQILEARILKSKRQIIAGYFDSPEKLAEAVQPWNGKAPIYCTLNPVHPGLLARYCNRLKDW